MLGQSKVGEEGEFGVVFLLVDQAQLKVLAILDHKLDGAMDSAQEVRIGRDVHRDLEEVVCILPQRGYSDTGRRSSFALSTKSQVGPCAKREAKWRLLLHWSHSHIQCNTVTCWI